MRRFVLATVPVLLLAVLSTSAQYRRDRDRYRDRYRRNEGEWRIAERRVLVDWTETRPVNPPGR